MKIVLAGATGDLGFRVAKALRRHDAEIVAFHRTGSDQKAIRALEEIGASPMAIDLADEAAVSRACEGADCVVSTLAGLGDVIIGTQGSLLRAAIDAGVKRFMPSDFCTDFAALPKGENRNLDLRREFSEIVNAADIQATSIRNGAFSNVLTFNIPILHYEERAVRYWGDAEHQINFTTMDDTAAYTAAAVLDPSAPHVLRISSFTMSPADLMAFSGRATGTPFELVRMGSLEDLSEMNHKARAANPDGEQELYSDWQRQQYLYTMLAVTQHDLANDRYPDLNWTSIEDSVPLADLVPGSDS